MFPRVLFTTDKETEEKTRIMLLETCKGREHEELCISNFSRERDALGCIGGERGIVRPWLT